MTLYIQLFLSGYGLEVDDLASLRTWGSLTPGHPEWGHTPGVETTTGPLGQGVGNAVGMAMAARRTRAMLDPEAAPGHSVFDHHVWVVASDGDLQEGVSGEPSSLADTQEFGNLTVIWDDNRISIEGETDIAFTEDVAARYAAYGWHVQHVDFNAGGSYVEDVAALDTALTASREEASRPSFIRLSTIIGWPAPSKQNTGGSTVPRSVMRRSRRLGTCWGGSTRRSSCLRRCSITPGPGGAGTCCPRCGGCPARGVAAGLS